MDIMKTLDMRKSSENERKANNLIECMYHAFNVGDNVGKLYSCRARIVFYNDYFVLVSYNTPIAIYDYYAETLYDLLRPVWGYTATSNMHVYKFKAWLTENDYPITNFVRFIK